MSNSFLGNVFKDNLFNPKSDSKYNLGTVGNSILQHELKKKKTKNRNRAFESSRNKTCGSLTKWTLASRISCVSKLCPLPLPTDSFWFALGKWSLNSSQKEVKNQPLHTSSRPMRMQVRLMFTGEKIQETDIRKGWDTLSQRKLSLDFVYVTWTRD